MQRTPKTRLYLILSIISLLSALIFRILFPSSVLEKLYGEYLYPFIRIILNGIQLIPLPFYLIFIVSILIIAGISLKGIFNKNDRKSAIIRLASLVLFISSLFFWLWGLNYGRKGMEERLQLKTTPYSKETFKTDFKRICSLALQERVKWSKEQSLDNIPYWKAKAVGTETLQLKNLKSVLAYIPGFQNKKTAPKIKRWPEGFLLRQGVAGMYFPFTGEPTLDGDLHPLRQPFTMIHEHSHAVGITGEGDCNLIAYLSSMRSNDPFVRYSAYHERISYMLYYALSAFPDVRKTCVDSMPQVIIEDMYRIKKHHAKYRGKLSDFGDWMNDQYLKTNGIESGVDDYTKWVLMLKAIEEKSGI
jgi:hypothetical protein